MNHGAMVVVLDMFMIILSFVLNLITTVNVKGMLGTMGATFNLVVVNLCFCNLLSAVLVKSFSLVHTAYAVAANTTQADIAMCSIARLGQHLTQAVLPCSVVALSWLTVLPRIQRLQVSS